MGWALGIAVYLTIWWTALFVVLPWGVKHQFTPDGGLATGAPINPGLKKKFIATTVLSLAIWLVIYALIKIDVIDFSAISARMLQEDLNK